MQLPKITEYHGIRVLTSSQVAEMYGTDAKTISYNFSYNKKKYVEGKHYIKLEGNELRSFKASREYPDCHKYSAHLYLWTEKGALLHAKSLNTDKAWEAYDYLVDFYFRVKEEQRPQTYREIREAELAKKKQINPNEVVDVPENPEVLKAIQKLRNDLTCMDVLLQRCIRYTSEKTYHNMRSSVAEVIPIIVDDWNKLYETKPKLVQRPY